jgi:hypothetical protein
MELVVPSKAEDCAAVPPRKFGNPSTYYASLRRTASLFSPSERLVQPRLATIGCVAMNDPTLRRFVDSRNRRANLIGGALWRQADLFLQSAQVRLNASIMGRSSKCLSGTFTG